ncbi:MAG TPA: dihydrolipoyl dehydrogenase [bacterium]|nr:dihydrolipoyl dehydrogenase [bacterium]HPN31753.1 dihydrolipoyl dehydrogenase [bacterium]
MTIKNYDYVIIGAGSANEFAFEAANKGYKTALIERGFAGGTCLNRGCIPTKVMLQSADIAHYVEESSEFGINSNITGIDFQIIKKRVADIVDFWRSKLLQRIESTPNLDYYNHSARFIGDKIIEAHGEKIRGNKFVIAVGMRPLIPKIKGLDAVEYLTNENILELKRVPKSIAVLGGGYIGMELAYFFKSLGSEVFIIEMKDKLLSEIEPSLSEKFNEYAEGRYKVFLNTKLESVEQSEKSAKLICDKNGEKIEIYAEKILVSTGRVCNTDSLDCEKSGILLDKRGYIITNDFFQTKNQDIWATGDCIGTPAFRHIANYQIDILMKNLLFGKRLTPDYSIVPYAVFGFPEIASVGLSLDSARLKNKNVVSKKLGYFGNAKGKALGYKGFCKAVIDSDTDKILGFHIIGPYASILIHEILPVMTAGLPFNNITNSIHIHPALSELVAWTFTEGN